MCQTRQKKRLVGRVVFVLMMLSAFSVFGATAKMSDLINKPDEWNGKTVSIEGEVIGDVMVRGDHAWINVSDGSGVMGIWITKDQAEKIKITGDYKFIGDTVTIEGIFHQTFTEQNGDMAIEAKILDIKIEGMRVIKPVSNEKVFWAIGLTLLVVILNWGRILIWTKQKLKWKINQ